MKINPGNARGLLVPQGDRPFSFVVYSSEIRDFGLTDEQKANNRVKSSVRSRIEHVFGFVENSLHGARSRYVGLARNHARHWMLVFCYNLNRLVQLKEYGFRKTLGPPTAPV